MPPRSRPISGRRLQEFRLINVLRRRFGQTGRSVLRGIGDDTAVVQPSLRRQLLLTTDLLAEGVHFDLATAGFEDVGYRAAVANLSDIAAMGGRPEYLLVALAIPSSCRSAEIEALYRGLMAASRPHGVVLIGGDISASQGGLFVSITLVGSVASGQALTRNTARTGDLLYVTGTLGDSLVGLEILSTSRQKRRTAFGRAKTRWTDPTTRFLIERHLRPTPRIKEGQALATNRIATAAIDLSDGLSGDLAHLCEESGVGAEVEAAALPLSPVCRAYAAAGRVDPIHLALKGGEDYELLFTVPPKHRPRLDRLAQQHGFRFSRIGTIRPKSFGVRLRSPDGTLCRLPVISYEHFQDNQEAPWSR
ncbi:MAG: thiamine-phosphate kinase, partial [Nitrospiraceae bacterium]